MSDIVISVENLGKRYTALRDVLAQKAGPFVRRPVVSWSCCPVVTRQRREAWIDHFRLLWKTSSMRLGVDEAKAIREEIQRSDPTAEIYLFGSRTDDAARGGDIDL